MFKYFPGNPKLGLCQVNWRLFISSDWFPDFDCFQSTRKNSWFDYKLITIGYNEHGYNEFTAITKKILRFWEIFGPNGDFTT